MIVQVTISLSLPVVRSVLSPVILAVFVKIVHQIQAIDQVMVIDPVASLVRPVKLKVLGLVVVKPVGYVSVIVTSVVSGPLFPYTIVYWISSPL